MASTGRSDQIYDQAAQWAVDVSYGQMTPERQVALDAWLAEDTRHRGAYARACASLYAMEDAVIGPPAALASDNDNARQSADVPRRRFRWLVPMAVRGAALAASIAVVAAIGWPMYMSSKHPAVASNQIVKLEDGSVATLEEGARIDFAMVDGVRKVTLLSGQASFEVAKDKSHFFVVQSGVVYAQATGTVYAVSRYGRAGGTVKVAEGSVLVWQHDDRDQAVLLRAGESVTLDSVPQVPEAAPEAPASPRLPPPELAQISLDDVSIKVAAARFNRVNRTKIVIEDPAIGEATIVGLYQANDPEQFAQAAALVSGGKVEHEEGMIVIKSK